MGKPLVPRSKCEHCGQSMGPRDWHIEVMGSDENWRILYGTVGNRSWVEGVYAGITDFTRCGDQLRLVDHTGDIIRQQKGGGGIQVGMRVIPHKKRFETP